ncbi:toxin glutamine deamidase domain-containing protein [Streptomyces sp. NPDC001848]|uniref:toxin glutamine deamidase domain-containing protein n=1 Tax=Streptomyces sp. NPDC001848 TaxID=3364618 RepID=UPI00368A90B4
MMLPDELEWVLQMLGYRWPTADEDKLKDCATLWRKFGDDVSDLHARANTSARTVVAHNAGESIDKFTKTYAKFDGGTGSDGYLASAAQAAYTIANVLEACAYLVEFAKWAVIAQLIALAFEIAAAQAAAPFTFGLSEAGALGATQVTRLIVRRLLDELKEALMESIVQALKQPAISAIQAIITDLIRQTVNVGFGAQHGYDLGKTVKAGADAGWDSIKQTPLTLAQGVRDNLGQKAGSRFHHAIDSRIDGYHESGTSHGDGEDGEGGGDGESESSSGSSSDSESGSSSHSPSDSESGSSSHSPSDSYPDSSSSSSSNSSSTASNDSGSSGSGSDSSTSTHTNTGAGTHMGGLSADTGGAHIGTQDVGAGLESDGSGSGAEHNPSPLDTAAPRHTTSLSDFDDPAPGATSHGASDATGSSGSSDSPSASGPADTGGSSPSGLSSPTPHAVPSHAPSDGATAPTGGGSGGIGTSIDSLAAGAPTQSHAAPTPTTTEHFPGGTDGRADGASSMPTSPTPPSTMDSGPVPRSTASTPGATSSTTGPTSPAPTVAPVRNPSSATPGTASPRETGPAFAPSPTVSSTTPRASRTSMPDGRMPGGGDGRISGASDGRVAGVGSSRTTGAGDGRISDAGDRRTSGTTDGRTSSTTDGRIPTQRTPGTASDDRAASRTTVEDRTAPRNAPGTTPSDRTGPRNITDERTAPRNIPEERSPVRDATDERTTPRDVPDERTTPRDVPDERTAARNTTEEGTTPRNTPGTTPGDRTAPRSTSDTTDARTPARGQDANPDRDSTTSGSPRTSSSSGEPERTSTPSSANTPNSSTQSGSTARPGDSQSPTASGKPGPQPQPGTRPTPNRAPNQPAGTAPGTTPHPHAPQEPASQHDRSETPEAERGHRHDPQHHQVTPVPIHTVSPAPSSPPSQASHASPPPPGAPSAHPGASPQQHPHQDSLNDIRNDLDHYPGGLTEPHPDDQQALVNAVPHNPDGTPERFPDPFGHWAQLQNDGGNTVPGRSNNCADCSRSFLETWYGNPQVSAPRTLDVDEHGNPDPWSPEHNANANQIRWAGAEHIYAGTGDDPHTADRIAWDLHQAGHGAAAIVQVSWPGGGGHAFNAVNHHGHIIWIDTQSGEVSHQPLHIPNATGVWHIPLDADRNPIHPTQPETDTTHHESETPHEGTETPHQEPDDSPQENESHQAPEPNPSHGTTDNVPVKDADAPETTPTADKPSDTGTDGHTPDSPSHTQQAPPHPDTPTHAEHGPTQAQHTSKPDELSTPHPYDGTATPASSSTHSSTESRDGNESDRGTPHERDGVAASDHRTRTDATHTIDTGTSDPAAEHEAPSATERPDGADAHRVTHNAPPSAPHTAAGDPAVDRGAPRHSPAPNPQSASASSGHPTSGSMNRPHADDASPAGRHTTPDQRPAAPVSHDHRAPAEPGAVSDHEKDPSAQTGQHREHGMLPEQSQADLRGTHDVHKVDLDRLYSDLSEWGNTDQLRDLLRQCGPPGQLKGISKQTLIDALRNPPFRDLSEGQQGAVVAAISRLSLKFHAELGVGSLDPGVPNPNDPAVRPLDHEEGSEKRERQEKGRESLAQRMKRKGTPSAGVLYHSGQAIGNPDRPALRKALGAEDFKALLENKGDWSRRNYATVEIFDPVTRRSTYISDSSLSMGRDWAEGVHSEPHILDYVDAVNAQREEGRKIQLVSFYTEREPCGPALGTDCSSFLGEHLPKEVKVYYGTPFRRGQIENEAELRAEGHGAEVNEMKDAAVAAQGDESQAYVDKLRGIWTDLAHGGHLS